MSNIESIITNIMVAVYGLISYGAFFVVLALVFLTFAILPVLIILFVLVLFKIKKPNAGQNDPQPGENPEAVEKPIIYINCKCSHCGSISMVEEGVPFLCPDCGSNEYIKM